MSSKNFSDEFNLFLQILKSGRKFSKPDKKALDQVEKIKDKSLKSYLEVALTYDTNTAQFYDNYGNFEYSLESKDGITKSIENQSKFMFGYGLEGEIKYYIDLKSERIEVEGADKEIKDLDLLIASFEYDAMKEKLDEINKDKISLNKSLLKFEEVKDFKSKEIFELDIKDTKDKIYVKKSYSDKFLFFQRYDRMNYVMGIRFREEEKIIQPQILLSIGNKYRYKEYVTEIEPGQKKFYIDSNYVDFEVDLDKCISRPLFKFSLSAISRADDFIVVRMTYRNKIYHGEDKNLIAFYKKDGNKWTRQSIFDMQNYNFNFATKKGRFIGISTEKAKSLKLFYVNEQYEIIDLGDLEITGFIVESYVEDDELYIKNVDDVSYKISNFKKAIGEGSKYEIKPDFKEIPLSFDKVLPIQIEEEAFNYDKFENKEIWYGFRSAIPDEYLHEELPSYNPNKKEGIFSKIKNSFQKHNKRFYNLIQS